MTATGVRGAAATRQPSAAKPPCTRYDCCVYVPHTLGAIFQGPYYLHGRNTRSVGAEKIGVRNISPRAFSRRIVGYWHRLGFRASDLKKPCQWGVMYTAVVYGYDFVQQGTGLVERSRERLRCKDNSTTLHSPLENSRWLYIGRAQTRRGTHDITRKRASGLRPQLRKERPQTRDNTAVIAALLYVQEDRRPHAYS